MGAGDVKEVSSQEGTNKRGEANTEVDETEEVGDVGVNDADQDHHAGHLGPEPGSKDERCDELGREAGEELADEDGDTIEEVDCGEDEEGFGSELVNDKATEDSGQEVCQAHETDQGGGLAFTDAKADGSVGKEGEHSIDSNVEKEHMDHQQQLGWSFEH